jgi:hypothetical protein
MSAVAAHFKLMGVQYCRQNLQIRQIESIQRDFALLTIHPLYHRFLNVSKLWISSCR